VEEMSVYLPEHGLGAGEMRKARLESICTEGAIKKYLKLGISVMMIRGNLKMTKATLIKK
jgi:hypothetical protein